MRRIYQTIIQDHLAQYRQMVFLSGPRQTGKTTLSQACVVDQYPYQYLNWDNIVHRELILKGIEAIYQQFQPDVLMASNKIPVIIFDEIHKYKNWKTMLKGYFDTIQDRCKIIVTGSAKLNVYRRGGDSMMGRYFSYRIHPLSVAEIMGRENFDSEIGLPKEIPKQAWQNLLTFGGFPEPYLNANSRFYQRWITLKQEQFFQEDLRDLSKIHDLAQLSLLSQLLSQQVSSTVKYSELAKKVRVSEPTIRRWISTLNSLYFCFSISPWSNNVTRSLLKEPKVYLWDWSVIEEQGAKIENLVACHLQKAIHFWTDIGLGNYDLYYLRDKEQHEVDFLVTKNKRPWLMVEVKSSDNHRISSNITHFNKQLAVTHVLQVVSDLDFVDRDCFALENPTIVPLVTFLSQLV
jgi:uncharacterized protein